MITLLFLVGVVKGRVDQIALLWGSMMDFAIVVLILIFIEKIHKLGGPCG